MKTRFCSILNRFQAAFVQRGRHAALALLGAMSVSAAGGAPIAVIGYDIDHATAAGFGGWAHAYTGGTITPVRNFTNGPGGPPGTVAKYANGVGTLNDGVIGTSIFDTQLFVQGNVDGGGEIRPIVKLKLATPALVGKIKIWGGNIDFNLFPGQITGVTVEIAGQSVAVTTTPDASSGFLNVFGEAADDTVDLAGTPLASIATDSIILRDFVFSSITGNQFSITELSVDGVIPPPPATRVGIDVKPGSRFNVINLQAGPKVRVAVLSSATFNALTVDPSSLRFGQTGNEPSLLSCLPPRDVNGDRRADLVCVFSVAASGLTDGLRTAKLKGTAGGVAIFGTDTVRVRSRYAHGERDDHSQDD